MENRIILTLIGKLLLRSLFSPEIPHSFIFINQKLPSPASIAYNHHIKTNKQTNPHTKNPQNNNRKRLSAEQINSPSSDSNIVFWASQAALVAKNPPANAGDVRDVGLLPGLGRVPGGGHGNPLQYSCLENPMDRGAWRSTVHGVTKSWTRLKRLSTHAGILCFQI